MPRPNYKTMYDAVVVNADRTTDALKAEVETLRTQVEVANDAMRMLALKVEIALQVLSGRKGEE